MSDEQNGPRVVDLDPATLEARDPQRDSVIEVALHEADLDHVQDPRDRVDRVNTELTRRGLVTTTLAEVREVQGRLATRAQAEYWRLQLETAPERERQANLRRRRIILPVLDREYQGPADRERALEAVNAALEQAGFELRLRSWEHLKHELRQPLPQPERLPQYETVQPGPAPEPFEQPGARDPAPTHRRRPIVQEAFKYLQWESHMRYPLASHEPDERALHDLDRLVDTVNRRLPAGDPTIGPELLEEDLEALGHRLTTPEPTYPVVDFDVAAYEAAMAADDPVEAALDWWEEQRRTR
jgi:hypothetical protein